MKVSFKDQVVCIMGASSGIGEVLTYALSACGARLILSSRRAAELVPGRIPNNFDCILVSYY